VTICLRGWLVACSIIIALYFYDHTRWGGSLLADIGSSGVFMLLTAIVVVGLLPLFEAAFRVLTDINLMEYMNPNNELLRRLMVEAPGTYQHSILLGSIAEAAAQAIGGNGLFCRVATLYHDIGKVAVAQYFTENQQSGMNIHQLLTPTESARVIISHVQEGVNLARRAGLPEPFIDIIREHHGTSLVYYFYHKQLEVVGHDASLVDERDFRYTGPKPRSKEAAIIMIADSFEAACRSIDELNEEILTRLIDQIVREKLEDGQLDECLLSFEELGLVKQTMVKSLLSIGHFRIKYPAKVRLKAAPV
jgi:cyclic-di-AMP phosphodiesterase PgpH